VLFQLLHCLCSLLLRTNKLRNVMLLLHLLKPSGFFTYRQVQYSKILHGARFALSVLYGSENRQRPCALYVINWMVFITVLESVYSAVRTDSLFKTEYLWSLKGATGRQNDFFQVFRGERTWYFQTILVSARYQSTKNSEFKCVNVTLIKTRNSFKLFLNVLLKKLISIFFPLPTDIKMICGP